MDKKYIPVAVVLALFFVGAVVYIVTRDSDRQPAYQQPSTNNGSDQVGDGGTDGTNGETRNGSGSDTDEPATVSRVNTYYIAVDDEGKRGPRIGCGDSVVAVEQSIAPTTQPLKAAYESLLDQQGQDSVSGLYNALSRSNLTFESATVSNGRATVRLAGEYLLGGTCDDPRFEAQLRYTALQFPTVNEVDVYINGESLNEIVRGGGN